MVEEQAIIVETQGEHAWVETQRKSACGSCSVNKGCGTSVVGKILGQKYSRLKVLTTFPVSVGDTVVIGIKESALVRGSFAVYMVPLLAMFILALLGEWFGSQYPGDGESLSVLFGLIGLGAGFYWLRRFSVKIDKNQHYQAVILRRATEENIIHMSLPGKS